MLLLLLLLLSVVVFCCCFLDEVEGLFIVVVFLGGARGLKRTSLPSLHTHERERERFKKKKKKKKSCLLTSWEHQDCNVIFSSRCLC